MPTSISMYLHHLSPRPTYFCVSFSATNGSGTATVRFSTRTCCFKALESIRLHTIWCWEHCMFHWIIAQVRAPHKLKSRNLVQHLTSHTGMFWLTQLQLSTSTFVSLHFWSIETILNALICLYIEGIALPWALEAYRVYCIPIRQIGVQMKIYLT